MFFTIYLEHWVSQVSLKRAQKAPNTTLDGLQEAIKREDTFLSPCLIIRNAPKTTPTNCWNLLNDGSKTWTHVVRIEIPGGGAWRAQISPVQHAWPYRK